VKNYYANDSFKKALYELAHLRNSITGAAAGGSSLKAYEDFREIINKAEGMLYVGKRDYDAALENETRTAAEIYEERRLSEEQATPAKSSSSL
jgi:hypothetical protein